jgi:peptide/nickel transport system permease protein
MNVKLNKDSPKKYVKRSMGAEVWRNFKKNKGAVIGLIVFGLIIAITIIGSIVLDYQGQVVKQNIPKRLISPSREHPFGTDQFGRDIMIRIIYGARYSLSVGVIAVVISFITGSMLGLVAGYYGGIVETIIMRLADVFQAIPSILLAIVIMTAFGQSLMVLMLTIGLVSVPPFSRVARAAVLPVREQEYIEAAKAAGASDIQIIFHHALPNSLAPILVQCTMQVAAAIVWAAGLSFLGIGVPLPAPEWGGMLAESRNLMRDHGYMTLVPGLAIMLTVMSINLIGDGLRDALDPKLKR